MDEMVFDDLEPIKVPVVIAGEKFTLYEASADAARKYRNATLRSAKMNDGKIEFMDGLADAETILISNCLRHVLPSGDGPFVKLELARSWLDRVTKPIFDRIKEISPTLVEKAKEKDLVVVSENKEANGELSKNLVRATTDISG